MENNQQNNGARASSTNAAAQVKKPKPPLTAYNLFFQLERRRILDGIDQLGLPITDQELASVAAEHRAKTEKRIHRRTHGKIGFKELAQEIAQRWKKLDIQTKTILGERAEIEKKFYREAFEEWKKTPNYQVERAREQLQQQEATRERARPRCSPAMTVAAPVVSSMTSRTKTTRSTAPSCSQKAREVAVSALVSRHQELVQLLDDIRFIQQQLSQQGCPTGPFGEYRPRNEENQEKSPRLNMEDIPQSPHSHHQQATTTPWSPHVLPRCVSQDNDHDNRISRPIIMAAVAATRRESVPFLMTTFEWENEDLVVSKMPADEPRNMAPCAAAISIGEHHAETPLLQNQFHHPSAAILQELMHLHSSMFGAALTPLYSPVAPEEVFQDETFVYF